MKTLEVFVTGQYYRYFKRQTQNKLKYFDTFISLHLFLLKSIKKRKI